MKPKPFASLNHFTVPVIRAILVKLLSQKLFPASRVVTLRCAADCATGAGEHASKKKENRRRRPRSSNRSLAVSARPQLHGQDTKSQVSRSISTEPAPPRGGRARLP